MGTLHRGQLRRVTKGELPQELPHRRGHVDASEQLPHSAGADDIQIIDTVRAARHPGDDRGQLPGRIHPSGSDFRRVHRDADLLADQIGQAARSASSSTGTSPAYDTRSASSNRASARDHPSGSFTLSAFSDGLNQDLNNPDSSDWKGHST
jgi:hypothetical protein